MQDVVITKVRPDPSLVDFSGLLQAFEAGSQRLKEQINAVVDAHMCELADTVTLTEMLTQIGVAIVNSTGDPRPIEVTVKLK